MSTAIPFRSFWVAGFIWGLITVGLIYWVVWWLHQNHLFETEGRTTQALVEKKFRESHQGRHGTTSCTYHLEYRYDVLPLAFDCTETVTHTLWQETSMPGNLRVRYLADNPGVHRIDEWPENRNREILLKMVSGLALFFLVSGVLHFGWLAHQNKKNRELVTQGASCRGVISTVDCRWGGRRRNLQQFFLVFTFRDQQGREITGRTWLLDPRTASLWRENSLIQVYFDPERPDRFTVDVAKGPQVA